MPNNLECQQHHLHYDHQQAWLVHHGHVLIPSEEEMHCSVPHIYCDIFNLQSFFFSLSCAYKKTKQVLFSFPFRLAPLWIWKPIPSPYMTFRLFVCETPLTDRQAGSKFRGACRSHFRRAEPKIFRTKILSCKRNRQTKKRGSVCQYLSVPYPKWLLCKRAFSVKFLRNFTVLSLLAKIHTNQSVIQSVIE